MIVHSFRNFEHKKTYIYNLKFNTTKQSKQTSLDDQEALMNLSYSKTLRLIG